MLAQLTISNFAIVRELEIDFQNGMTVITGETGAGKSIAIDALGLCLGGRADADMVRAGAMRADLCAGWKRTSLRKAVSVCCVALSAAMAAPVGLLTEPPFRYRSCASWASYLFKSMASMRISS